MLVLWDQHFWEMVTRIWTGLSRAGHTFPIPEREHKQILTYILKRHILTAFIFSRQPIISVKMNHHTIYKHFTYANKWTEGYKPFTEWKLQKCLSCEWKIFFITLTMQMSTAFPPMSYKFHISRNIFSYSPQLWQLKASYILIFMNLKKT